VHAKKNLFVQLSFNFVPIVNLPTAKRITPLPLPLYLRIISIGILGDLFVLVWVKRFLLEKGNFSALLDLRIADIFIQSSSELECKVQCY